MQLNKLKSAAKSQTGITLRMNIKMLNRNNLHRELISTKRQATKLRNTYENNMSTDIKFFKTQISKIIPYGGFLGLKVAVSLAKNILAPLGITAAASAIDSGIQKKNTLFWNNNFNNFKQRNG